MVRQDPQGNQVSPEAMDDREAPETPAQTPLPRRLPLLMFPIARLVKPRGTAPPARKDPRGQVEKMETMEAQVDQHPVDLQDRPVRRDQMEGPATPEDPVKQALQGKSFKDLQSSAHQAHLAPQEPPEAPENRDDLPETGSQAAKDSREIVENRAHQAFQVVPEVRVNPDPTAVQDPVTTVPCHELLRAIEDENSRAPTWKEIEMIEKEAMRTINIIYWITQQNLLRLQKIL